MNKTVTRIQLIDGPQIGFLDLKENTSAPINFKISDIRDTSQRSGSYSKVISLVGNKNNNLLLNNYFDVNVVAGTFNVNKKQKCAIIQNGTIIKDNLFLRLLKVTKIQNQAEVDDDYVEYEVQVRDGLGDFFKEINNKELTDLKAFDTFTHNYTPANVISSFNHTWTDGYKYVLPWINTFEYPITELLPGIYARQYWDKIHQQAGYSYTWSQMDDGNVQFSKLLIPYSGDKKKLSDDYKNSVEVIAQNDTTLVYPQTVTPAIGSLGFIKKIKVDIEDEIKDNLNLYDDVNSLYNNPYIIEAPNTLVYEIEYDYDLIYTNNEAVPVYMGGQFFGSLQFRLELINQFSQIKGNGNLKFSEINNANSTVNQVVEINPNNTSILGIKGDVLIGSKIYWPTGDTLVASGKSNMNISATNINSGDDLYLSLFTSLANQPTGTVWRTDTGFADMKYRIEVNNIRIRILPQLENALIPGGPVLMNGLVPVKIKQAEFIKSIYQKYNLYAEIDPDNPNNIIYTSRDKFYDDGKLKDWTQKLNKSIPETIEFVPEISSKRLILSYKDDNKDAYLTAYRDEVAETYGQVEVIFENENVTGVKRNEEIFSPTINIYTDFNANVPVLDPEYKHNIRILYDGGKLNCNNYSIRLSNSSATTLNEYPFLSMLDRPEDPTFDISYAQPDYYSYDLGEGTENNMYTNHWRRTLSQINSGKLFTGYFHLTEIDIANLKLSDKIKVNNAIWYINAIIDYDANSNKLTKVELLSIEDDLKLPRFGRIINTGGPFGPVGPGGTGVLRPTKPIGTGWLPGILKDLILDRYKATSVLSGFYTGIIDGIGNLIPSGFKGMLIGNYKTPQDDGYYVEDTYLIDGKLSLSNDTNLTDDGLQLGGVSYTPNGIFNFDSYVEDEYIDIDYFENNSSNIGFETDPVTGEMTINLHADHINIQGVGTTPAVITLGLDADGNLVESTGGSSFDCADLTGCSSFTDLQNDVSDLQNDVTDIENDITTIQNDITDIENDISTIENDIINIVNDIADIDNDITNIENDITTIQNDITDLENANQLGGRMAVVNTAYFDACLFAVVRVARLLPSNQQNLYLNPIIFSKDMTITNMRLQVGTAVGGSNFRILLYESANGDLPLTKIHESGNLSSATTGYRTNSGLSIPVNKGKLYFLGYHCDDNNVQVSSIPLDFAYSVSANTTIGGAPIATYRVNVPFGSAPATVSSVIVAASINPTGIQLRN